MGERQLRFSQRDKYSPQSDLTIFKIRIMIHCDFKILARFIELRELAADFACLISGAGICGIKVQLPLEFLQGLHSATWCRLRINCSQSSQQRPAQAVMYPGAVGVEREDSPVSGDGEIVVPLTLEEFARCLIPPNRFGGHLQ